MFWRTLQYGYDWQHNMIRRKIVGGFDVHYTYDPANRLLTVGTSGDADRWDELSYWPTGQVKQDKFRENATTVGQEVDHYYK